MFLEIVSTRNDIQYVDFEEYNSLPLASTVPEQHTPMWYSPRKEQKTHRRALLVVETQ